MAVLSFPWRKSAALPDSAATPTANDRLSLLAAVVDLLPDPVLIVQRAAMPNAPVRVMASNAAAQELLRIRGDGESLIAVLRHPEVLGTVENTLATGEGRTMTYETGGPQSRAFRVWTKMLENDARQSALVVLRDETDARRLERMRADFLANASHELRTPLASITAYVETLQGHARDDIEARDRFLAIMSVQARRMGRLIDDLMSLSRIELNERVPPSGVCDVALVAREVIDGLLPVCSGKNVRLQLTAPAGSQVVASGERDQIAQVMQNLIDNAVKYAPEGTTVLISVNASASFEPEAEGPDANVLREQGGGRVCLVSPERSHEQRYVMVRIADQGSGIAREHLPRLTERFYRVPGQKSGEIGGTGLGLAIVKHIVNRHRGGLAVESVPGQGTVFAVFLPQGEFG
ncbi:MAG: ATPase [Alphaproteobacteria bacterium]|nr:ATPase [Alphaproteobacteria bacterium]